ncbi:MAG: type II toxin-antitoxin system VapB family antitoxin [Chloroflexi bacterium]|nr:type II toxin-antitoxin system VapB family antitoxin [Chloroflexota bacterium]
MRRTVVIDDDLLEDAKKEFGTKGIRETIEAAMREGIRKRRLEEFRLTFGTWDLELTPEMLEQLRDDSCRTRPDR